MTQLNANPAVAQSLLDRFPLTSPQAAESAIAVLYDAVKLSMTQTQAYNLPTDQLLPPDSPVDAACTIVHPLNIAAVLVSLYRAIGSTAPGDLQVYDNGAWKLVAQYEPMVGLNAIIAAPPAPAPVAPPPAPAPAPAPAAPPPAPEAAQANPADLMSLVDSALGTPTAPQAQQAAAPAPPPIAAPETTPATPVAPVRPVIEGEATRVAPQAPTASITTPEQYEAYRVAQQAGQLQSAPPAPPAPGGKLPSADVTLPRMASTGRENKSPFTAKVEERKKIAAAPWWQDFWSVSAGRLFTQHPSQALDDSSTGSGPVQAYAALIALQKSVLAGVDPSVTVAELRTFLDEVESGIAALPDAAAINQLRDALAGNAK